MKMLQKKSSTTLFFLCNFIFILEFSQSAWSMGSKLGEHAKPVQWEENATWTFIEPHWAITYNKDNQPLAIYDLSYPTLNQQIDLGFLDFSAINYKNIIQLLQGYAYTTPASSQTTPTQSAQPSPDPKLKSVILALTQLDAQHEEEELPNQKNSPLPKNWWKSVAWKTSHSKTPFSIQAIGQASQTAQNFAQQDSPPTRFTLGSFDYEQISKNYTRFLNALAQLGKDLNFLDQFEFRQTVGGGYHLYWNPPLDHATQISRPKKLADLRCPECSLEENFSKEVLTLAISQLIGLIPNATLAGLVGSALGEWVHLQTELLKIHQDELAEMLQMAHEPVFKTTPFNPLTPEQLGLAAQGLMYAGSNILTSWMEFFNDPNNTWQETENGYLQKARQAGPNLTQQGYTLTYLNPRFALAKKETQTQIFALAGRNYWSNTPVLITDDQNPDGIAFQRQGIEGANLLVHFASSTIPVPLVGLILSEAFERIVHGPMHAQQHWDSRLNVALQLQQVRGEQNWEQEMQWIQAQSANPLASSWSEIVSTVTERRNLLPAK